MSCTHALVIATEKASSNDKEWWSGNLPHYYSGKRTLQNLVGDGGTLWIFRSMQNKDNIAEYSLMMRLDKCQRITIENSDKPFGVTGIKSREGTYPMIDGKSLLRTLTFLPYQPLPKQGSFGQALRNPKHLNSDDVKILEEYQNSLDFPYEDTDWSCYQNLSITEKKQYRTHRRIERNPQASKKAKEVHGTVCQACNFDFKSVYGKIGEGFIEAHHLKELSLLEEGKIEVYNIQKDFAVLCSNCHRMIHRTQNTSDINEFKKLIIK